MASPSEVEVAICIDPGALQKAVANCVRSAGYRVVLLQRHELSAFRLRRGSFVIIGTGEDVGALVQLANDLYRSNDSGGLTLPILAVVPDRALSANPSLGSWFIEEHPAVQGVWQSESLDPSGLLRFIGHANLTCRLDAPDQP